MPGRTDPRTQWSPGQPGGDGACATAPGPFRWSRPAVPIVDRWAECKSAGEWLFHAPGGGPLSEANWKRSVGWSKALGNIGRLDLHVHDLRHTAASVRLASGADPKVVPRILGHASAAMTMDLYGHLVDDNLWAAARRVDEATRESGGLSGASGSSDDGSPAAGNGPEPG